MIPVDKTLHVRGTYGGTDRFGNPVRVLGGWQPVMVAGWWISRVEEKTGDSVLRTVSELSIITPAGVLSAEQQVQLPDGSVWEVHGEEENYQNGPWWNPGLVVVNCKKVSG